MKASVEQLHHFNCSSCDRWWSIGDFLWGSQGHLWCPWCGHKNELPEQPLTAKDFVPRSQPCNKPGRFSLEELKALRLWGTDK